MAHVISDSQETEKGGSLEVRSKVPILTIEATLSQESKFKKTTNSNNLLSYTICERCNL